MACPASSRGRRLRGGRLRPPFPGVEAAATPKREAIPLPADDPVMLWLRHDLRARWDATLAEPLPDALLRALPAGVASA